MALMWMMGITVYGLAATNLGESGFSLGWPIFIGMAIIASNVWRFITGEWKVTGSRPNAINIVGIVLLLNFEERHNYD